MLSGQGPAGSRLRRHSDRGSSRPARRGGVRPAEGSRARRSTPEAPARRVRAQLPKRLSGRATVLGLLLIALGLAYAYPVRVLLAQQAQIDFMLESQNDQRARIAKLNSDLAKWNDDEYV